MKNTERLFLALAALAVAGLAHAGKPIGDHGAKATKAAAKAQLPQVPATMADAANTKMQLADGSEGYLVPRELYNTLSVVHDADGKTRVVETDGAAAPVAVEVQAHE